MESAEQVRSAGEPRHIAIVCPGCGGTGAVGNVALHHAAELTAYARVSLLSDSFPNKRFGNVDFLLLRPQRYDWLRRFAHVPNEFAFAVTARRAVEQLEWESGVDLVICHGHPVAALAAKPLKKRLGVPYALVTHGDIFDRPKGTYDPRLTWFYRRTTGPAYRNADLVVALSPHMRDLAIRGGAAPEKMAIIPNGIDPMEIGLKKNAPGRKPFVVGDRLELLYVGRLAREKGVDVLLEACAQMARQGMDFQLRVVGNGPEAEACRNLADRLELVGRVTFLGVIPRFQLGPLYQSAHLVCVPSRSDPLPTVVLEAMEAGTPVIGAKVGGIPALVTDGVDGLLVAPEVPEGLAKVLMECARNPQVVDRMSRELRRTGRKSRDWATVAQRLYVACRETLPGWSLSPRRDSGQRIAKESGSGCAA